jgi:hypothetical protein
MLIRNVNVPTHVVSAMADLCPCSSKPDRSQAVLDALMSAPTKDRIAFPGGDTQQSDVCQALTPHGYLHIENGPVSDIANWVKTH